MCVIEVFAVVLSAPSCCMMICTKKSKTAAALMEISILLQEFFRFGVSPILYFKNQYSVPNPTFKNLPEKHA